MRRTFVVIVASVAVGMLVWLSISSPTQGQGASSGNMTKDEIAIHEALNQFCKAMKDRDLPAIQRIFHSPAMAVEASGKSCRIEVLDTQKSEGLLPPAGNKDWDKMTVSDVDVHISATHPSVGMVSFVFVHALDEEQLKRCKAVVADPTANLDEPTKSLIQKIIQKKSEDSSMFALVGKTRGGWKIVSMTFPH